MRRHVLASLVLSLVVLLAIISGSSASSVGPAPAAGPVDGFVVVPVVTPATAPKMATLAAKESDGHGQESTAPFNDIHTLRFELYEEDDLSSTQWVDWPANDAVTVVFKLLPDAIDGFQQAARGSVPATNDYYIIDLEDNMELTPDAQGLFRKEIPAGTNRFSTDAAIRFIFHPSVATGDIESFGILLWDIETDYDDGTIEKSRIYRALRWLIQENN